MRLALVAVFLVLAVHAGEPRPSYPLWDGQESIEHYANRVNLPPTKTLDLGNGVNLELVLIPAGKFIMGTPEPVPVDEAGFRKKIIVGKAFFAVGVAVLLVLIGTITIRAIRQRRRLQYSLARFMVMIVAASVGVLGGMHWWFSTRALAQAQAEYIATWARYMRSFETEKPAHEVRLTTPCYMGKYPVTQEQFKQVTGSDLSSFKGSNLPVETVSWDDTQEFCKAVARSSGSRGDPAGRPAVRLPTEAEWEYACRAGTTTNYYTGDAESDFGRAAWYSPNSKGKTHLVGQKKPNAFGLHDTHGNVWEWCQDWLEEYKAGAVVDPQGPPEGQYRVMRGGSWYNCARDCRSACRAWRRPGDGDYITGFRMVVAP
ncbi:MAG: formylglycine-generating enzyme family protein [Planctomycetota bacterium]|nr:formylglycine-generating enzyme family protein [Planctomycetota bacterium]